MKRYTLKHRKDLTGVTLEQDAPKPELATPTSASSSGLPGNTAYQDQIRINIKCLSLNARDLQIATGDYPAPHDIPENVVPISDGAGVVEAVGSEVTQFKVGDRVAPIFPQGHHFEEDLALRSLKRGLGGGIDGLAAEYFVCDEQEAVHIPSNFSFADGSTLAIAFSTAWSSLFTHHPKLKAGETVLCLGTGGVSLCAAQLALITGARVILTSSSQAKLDRATELLRPLAATNAPDNVISTIDYSKVTDWDQEVRRLTNGRGVDFVIEIGGRGTIARSVRSTRKGGLVAVSGYLSDYKHIPKEILEEDLAKTILYSAANVRGVFAANREEIKLMCSALEAGGVKPVIDKVFPFDQLLEAYQYMADGKHFGKICVEV